MGLSSRLLLISSGNALARLAQVDSDRLCRSQGKSRASAFSAQRVSWASLVVELSNRQPVRLVYRSLTLMQSDDTGRLDVDRMNRKQAHRVDSALAPVLTRRARRCPDRVIDKSRRFAARGGMWTPPAELSARLSAAALGRLPCPRTRLDPCESK